MYLCVCIHSSGCIHISLHLLTHVEIVLEHLPHGTHTAEGMLSGEHDIKLTRSRMTRDIQQARRLHYRESSG